MNTKEALVSILDGQNIHTVLEQTSLSEAVFYLDTHLGFPKEISEKIYDFLLGGITVKTVLTNYVDISNVKRYYTALLKEIAKDVKVTVTATWGEEIPNIYVGTDAQQEEGTMSPCDDLHYLVFNISAEGTVIDQVKFAEALQYFKIEGSANTPAAPLTIYAAYKALKGSTLFEGNLEDSVVALPYTNKSILQLQYDWVRDCVN